MEYLRTVSRKGRASSPSAKPPEGKLGQWPWLASGSVKRDYKHGTINPMQKNSHVFGLWTSGNPKNRQINHYWYAWGQSGSVTSDNLLKAIMRCQRSHYVMCGPKSCIMSSFQSMAASTVDENTISLKSRSEVVPLMTSQLRDLTWPGHFFAKSCAKDAP